MIMKLYSMSMNQCIHQVGLMRHGAMLAENDPAVLMRMYNKQHLEDVFLELCVDTAANSESPHMGMKSIPAAVRRQSIVGKVCLRFCRCLTKPCISSSRFVTKT